MASVAILQGLMRLREAPDDRRLRLRILLDRGSLEVQLAGTRSRPAYKVDFRRSRRRRTPPSFTTGDVNRIVRYLVPLGVDDVSLIRVLEDGFQSERLYISDDRRLMLSILSSANMYGTQREAVLNDRRAHEQAARNVLPLDVWLGQQHINRPHSRNMAALMANNEDLKDPILQNYPSAPHNALYITSNVAGDKVHGVYDPESLYRATVGVRNANGRNGLSPATREKIGGVRKLPPHLVNRIQQLAVN